MLLRFLNFSRERLGCLPNVGMHCAAPPLAYLRRTRAMDAVSVRQAVRKYFPVTFLFAVFGRLVVDLRAAGWGLHLYQREIVN